MNIDERLQGLRGALDSKLDVASSPKSLASRRRSRRRRKTLLGLTAVALVAASALGLARHDNDHANVVTSTGDFVSVTYERFDYVQHAELTCAAGPVAPPQFDEATFEVWADQMGRRWRSRITYPDGSTYSVIAEGSPWYPTQLFTRDEVRTTRLGCADPGVQTLVAAPGENSFFSLNPLAPIPTVLDPLGGPSRPAVQTYQSAGTHVPEAATDHRGRPCERWEQVIDGFAGDSSGPTRPVHQIQRWCVDTAGKVLEHTFENTYEGVGTASRTETLADHSVLEVPQELFATDGYISQPVTPPPPEVQEPTASSVSASASSS